MSMSGHSKWSTIKHKKAALDAKRGKVFTKIIKEITVAARVGGGDPAGNPRLRFLLDKAKAANMPSENAIRAVKKGTGELPGVHYESHMYEGYGPEGTAVLIDVLTDNKNRAIADLRHFFSRNNGRIAENGAVSWMFERAGVIHATGDTSEDALIELLMEFPVKDIQKQETEDAHQVFTITCEPAGLEEIKHALTENGLKVTEAEVEWLAKSPLSLSEAQDEKVFTFLEGLEELEDVQNVYSNIG